MNALIKVIITTIISLFGTLTEVEDNQGHVQTEMCREIPTIDYNTSGNVHCCFNETPIKMLKYKFES
jgi:hypothetical protein